MSRSLLRGRRVCLAEGTKEWADLSCERFRVAGASNFFFFFIEYVLKAFCLPGMTIGSLHHL